MKNIIAGALLLMSCIGAYAQGLSYRYPTVFQFVKDSTVKDTSLSLMQLNHWAKGEDFPSVLKWKNSPFELQKNAQDTLKLCTDSITTYNDDDVIGYMFFKTGITGTFRSDYKMSSIGKHVFNSASPNIDIDITAEGIRMKAHGNIGPNVMLTINYQDLYDMFPNDPTIAFVNY